MHGYIWRALLDYSKLQAAKNLLTVLLQELPLFPLTPSVCWYSSS